MPIVAKVTLDEALRNTTPAPLLARSMLAVVPVALFSAVLGMAEGALSGFVDAVKVRETRGAVAGGNRRMAEFATVQSRVAEATASIDAARLLILRDLSFGDCRLIPL